MPFCEGGYSGYKFGKGSPEGYKGERDDGFGNIRVGRDYRAVIHQEICAEGDQRRADDEENNIFYDGFFSFGGGKGFFFGFRYEKLRLFGVLAEIKR